MRTSFEVEGVVVGQQDHRISRSQLLRGQGLSGMGGWELPTRRGSEPVIADLRDHRHELVVLCRQFGVRRLEVFGSATGEEFDPARSDIDFLVEFQPPEGSSRFDAFFGLKEGLEALLSHPVDLVDPSALDNPYFAETVAHTRQELYAA